MVDGQVELAQILQTVPTSLPSVMMAPVVNLHTFLFRPASPRPLTLAYRPESRCTAYAGEPYFPPFAVGGPDLDKFRLRGDLLATWASNFAW